MPVVRVPNLLLRLCYAALVLCCASTSARATEEKVIPFVLANARFVVLHEMGHLLLNELKVPIFGREEDAADQIGFSAFFVLPDYRDDPALPNYLADISRYWRLQAGRIKPEAEKIYAWNSHPLDSQRFYNLACLAYGSDVQTMEWVLEETGLPPERALYCDQEYDQALHALHWLRQTYKRPPDRPKMPITVHFAPIENELEEHRAFIEKVRLSGELEAIASRTSTDFDLPRPLSIQAMSCHSSDAYFDRRKGEIILCYEYLLQLREFAKLLP